MALKAPAALLALLLCARTATAQVPALRDANAAAAAGDWARVSALVEPLLRGPLALADAAEAHRLAGLADFFQQRRGTAEAHFVAYLRHDLDGRLDPVLYPPDVVAFFDDVRTRHRAELRPRPPPRRRFWLLNLVPPGGQIQNGHTTKAWLVGGGLGVLVVTQITTYAVLRAWCTRTSGPGGDGATCDGHTGVARTLSVLNVAAAIGAIAVYAFGVYDGAANYRRQSHVQPYVSTIERGGLVGVAGSF